MVCFVNESFKPETKVKLLAEHKVFGLNFRLYGGASLVAQMVKNLSATQGTWVRSLGQEDEYFFRRLRGVFRNINSNLFFPSVLVYLRV